MIFLLLPLLLLWPANQIAQGLGYSRLKASLLLLLWLGATGVASAFGFFTDFSLPPRLPPFVLLQFFAIGLIVFKAPAQRLATLPWAWLILPQIFRVAVEFGLAGLVETNQLPKEMSYHGRNFDIVIGITAPLVFYVASKLQNPRRLLLAWNWLGILVLSNVVLHGLLSMPYSFHLLTLEPSPAALVEFPFIWLPLFLVPFAYFLHIASLRKLGARK